MCTVSVKLQTSIFFSRNNFSKKDPVFLLKENFVVLRLLWFYSKVFRIKEIAEELTNFIHEDSIHVPFHKAFIKEFDFTNIFIEKYYVWNLSFVSFQVITSACFTFIVGHVRCFQMLVTFFRFLRITRVHSNFLIFSRILDHLFLDLET